MADNLVACPVCGKQFAKLSINIHVNQCINSLEEELDEVKSPMKESDPHNAVSRPNKRMRMDIADETYATVSPSSATLPESTAAAFNSSRSPLTNPGQASSSTVGQASAWSALGFNMKSSNFSAKSNQSRPSRRIAKSRKGPNTGASSTSVNGNQQGQKGPIQFDGSSSENDSSNDVFVINSPASTTPNSRKSSMTCQPQSRRDTTPCRNLKMPEQNSSASAKKNLFGKDEKNVQEKIPRNTVGINLTYGRPLAEHMRPSCIAEYVGQEQVLGKEKLIRTLVESHRIPSMILWGPPGCGKTTLARIIANRCKQTHDTRFVALSATTAGISDVKEVVKVARNEKKFSKRSTILFIDEIHRFNKLQQDTFLPHVEDGTIILMGATTENPSFQVNNALLSRCRVVTLEKLSVENVKEILDRSVATLGLQMKPAMMTGNEVGILVEDAALTTLAQLCDGDARAALNCLQMAVTSKAALQKDETDVGVVTVDDIEEGLQRSHLQYDRAGEDHYNCASALQKSIRGSDENGAIYWFSRMIEGGEDPMFIARRLVVTASEDIGLADPHALPLAVSTMHACQLVGLPECSINLAHCVAYLAKAPKSNESYMAMTKARQVIKECAGPQPGVPLHLRNAPTTFMKKIGYGKGYKYSHAHPGGGGQTYLPESLLNVKFFGKNF